MTTLHLSRFSQTPLVGAVMTPFPHFVRPDDTAATVRELMDRFDIRHIPVHDAREPVGVISEQELTGCAEDVPAKDIMLPDPYVVGIGASLAEVAREMGSRRCGAALVVRHSKLAGIVSVTDVCHLLADVLEDCFPDDGGDVA
jgi:CBS domain-containing protein